MIGYKVKEKSMLHFNNLLNDSHYKITVETRGAKTQKFNVITDEDGEIIVAQMTKIIPIKFHDLVGDN